MADKGKVFTRIEAESQFGSIRKNIQFSAADLTNLLEKAGENIMFKIKNGKLIILDSKRNVLYPEGEKIDDKEVFNLYSVSMVKQFMDSNKDQEMLDFEEREKAFTISGENLILDLSSDCPPWCE